MYCPLNSIRESCYYQWVQIMNLRFEYLVMVSHFILLAWLTNVIHCCGYWFMMSFMYSDVTLPVHMLDNARVSYIPCVPTHTHTDINKVLGFPISWDTVPLTTNLNVECKALTSDSKIPCEQLDASCEGRTTSTSTYYGFGHEVK